MTFRKASEDVLETRLRITESRVYNSPSQGEVPGFIQIVIARPGFYSRGFPETREQAQADAGLPNHTFVFGNISGKTQ
jgi:hypothetical protein